MTTGRPPLLTIATVVLLMALLLTLAAGKGDDAETSIAQRVLEGAKAEVTAQTQYHETYERLEYPDGDVPSHYGVCTDLVVRAFRNAGIDIQQQLHEDRKQHPEAYPTQLWEYKKPDKNIDHRRCQNMVVWFERNAKAIDADSPTSWKPGDVIFFIKPSAAHPWHVGVISKAGNEPKMIHLFPPTANEDDISRYGEVHSVYRWE